MVEKNSAARISCFSASWGKTGGKTGRSGIALQDGISQGLGTI